MVRSLFKTNQWKGTLGKVETLKNQQRKNIKAQWNTELSS